VVARRYNVFGRVHGVGFRNYVEHVAGKVGLYGYVRNRRDGRVEVFAMGTPERLKQMRVALEKGPMMSHVTSVSEEPDTVEPKYIGNFIIEITVE
jgi:acylphosphatase